jgi:hypothetical protein
MTTIFQAQFDQVRRIDAQLAAEALDFALLLDRDAPFGGGQRKQSPHQCQLLIVSGGTAVLACDDEIVGAPEQPVGGLCEADDEHRLIGVDAPFVTYEAFHHFCLARADVLIGVCHTAEQIRKLREIACPRRLETVERVEKIP